MPKIQEIGFFFKEINAIMPGEEDEGEKATKNMNMGEIKQKVKELQALKAEANEAGESNKEIGILRRSMNRLKKRTRKVA